MAMFNFEFGDKQQAKKPMRSYIDIDENGRATARVYADEYDAVKSNQISSRLLLVQAEVCRQLKIALPR